MLTEHLRAGWGAEQEGQVCQVTVGVLGDVCRAVEDQILPYCDSVMSILLQNLQSTVVSRDLKPAILSIFGDIALALGDRFETYLAHVLQVSLASPWLHACVTHTGRMCVHVILGGFLLLPRPPTVAKSLVVPGM